MAPFFFVLALLVPMATASLPTGNCVNITLPGILNLGRCFGTSLNLCMATPTGLVTTLTKLLTCLITPLTTTSITGLVTALTDIITIVLRTIGFGFFLTFLQGALTPLCALGGSTIIPGCAMLLTGNQTCAAPISITLPDTFNISRCVNQTLLLCQNGTLATDQLLLNLINTVTCFLTSVLTTNPGTTINGLVCLVAGLLQAIPGLNVLAFLLHFTFRCQ